MPSYTSGQKVAFGVPGPALMAWP